MFGVWAEGEGKSSSIHQAAGMQLAVPVKRGKIIRKRYRGEEY